MIEIALLTITILIVYMVQNKSSEKAYKNFFNNPYPFWIPIIGNSYLFFKSNILKVVQKHAKLYGDSFIMYIPHRTYFTSKPEDLKIILNHPNCLDKSKEYDHLQIIFANSLLLVPEATLGVKSTILQDEEEHVFVKGVTEVQLIAFSRIANLIKMNDFLFSFIKDFKTIKHHINACNQHISKILTEKRNLMVMNKDIMLNVNKLPLLDLLLQVSEKEELTNEYIEKEMFLFAGAATDTTAYSLAYTCFLLAVHPEIQEKVYQEVISVCGFREIGNDHLSDLKYTEMVICESQRLIPVIPMVGRKTTADIDLGDSIIPANTNIVLNFMSLHRNPNIYPNPLVFDPNRFLAQEMAKRPQYSFLPFSGGPRNCIGLKYAMMVMKTAIANIVRHFHITTSRKSVEELDFESSVVMVSTIPLDIKYTERQK